MLLEEIFTFNKDRIYEAELIGIEIEEDEGNEEGQLLFAFELCGEPGFIVTGTCDMDLGAGSRVQRWLSALSSYYSGIEPDELRHLIGSVAGIKIETMTAGAFTFYLVGDVVRSRDELPLAS